MGDLGVVGADPRILAHQIVEQVVAEYDARRAERDAARPGSGHQRRDVVGVTSSVALDAESASMDAPSSGRTDDLGNASPVAVPPTPSEPVQPSAGDAGGATGRTAVREHRTGPGLARPVRQFARLRRAQFTRHTLHRLREADLARRGRRWIDEVDLARRGRRWLGEADDVARRGLRRVREVDVPRRGLQWVRDTDLRRRGLRRLRGAEPGRLLDREGVRWMLVLAIGVSLFAILLMLLIETLSGLLTF